MLRLGNSFGRECPTNGWLIIKGGLVVIDASTWDGIIQILTGLNLTFLGDQHVRRVGDLEQNSRMHALVPRAALS
jgi:hypothetical protein